MPRNPPGGIDTIPFLSADASLTAGVAKTLAALEAARIVPRIWERDHTVWRDDPTEIADRLGWLPGGDGMRAETAGIREFTDGLGADDVRDVLLLGMGGSSLAPEVFARTFGSAPGAPRLHVLDTTSPGWIRRVTAAVRPDGFHALVASKSGSTIEVQTLFAHFQALARAAGGGGRQFTAITDPATALEKLATEEGFRHCFRNPPDLGGRYSALSFFGLVPAGVLGVDLESLLGRAVRMAGQCGPSVRPAENPGAALGALLGAAARAGRDKLTLLMSPRIESFGLWVEQLLAESTGKDGKGIVPIAGEPAVDAARYGPDRIFVCVRLANDENGALDRRADALAAAGQPVARLDVPDELSLGAEMYRWELATAVAGHLLGIQPFDQPDVQSAKTRTAEILEALTRGETPPAIEPGDATALLRGVREGDFVGVMVYGDPGADVERAVHELRRDVLEARGVATTYGIGPRFLHSTGQLHKGYSDRCAFLQVVLDEGSLPIPGRPFGFGELMSAQAGGDLLALRAKGKRIVRVATDGDAAGALRDLTAATRNR